MNKVLDLPSSFCHGKKITELNAPITSAVHTNTRRHVRMVIKLFQRQLLTLYTLTSVCIFSILFSLHFLWYWQGIFSTSADSSVFYNSVMFDLWEEIHRKTRCLSLSEVRIKNKPTKRFNSPSHKRFPRQGFFMPSTTENLNLHESLLYVINVFTLITWHGSFWTYHLASFKINLFERKPYWWYQMKRNTNAPLKNKKNKKE